MADVWCQAFDDKVEGVTDSPRRTERRRLSTSSYALCFMEIDALSGWTPKCLKLTVGNRNGLMIVSTNICTSWLRGRRGGFRTTGMLDGVLPGFQREFERVRNSQGQTYNDPLQFEANVESPRSSSSSRIWCEPQPRMYARVQP